MLENMKKSLPVYSYAEKTAFAVSAVTICLFFLLTNYVDINALLRTHIFFDSVRDGTVAHFYDYMSASNMHNNNLLSRLPLLIWYLPSWIVTRLLGGGGNMSAYETFYHQIWHKLYLAAMYFMCIKAVTELCICIGREKQEAKYCPLILAVSPGVILSVFYAGQDEIVYIAFFMYALLHYVKGNKRRYYFWAVWSILCCPLMMMPYLLLVVMDEKEWYVIGGKLMLPLIPQWLYAAFFSRCLTYRYTDSDHFLSAYFNTNKLDTGHGAFSILAVILILIFAFAYLHNPDKRKPLDKLCVFFFLCTIMFAALEIFGWDQFYRKFLWVPFAVLFAVTADKAKEDKVYLAVIMATDAVQSVCSFYQLNLVSNDKISTVTVIAQKAFGKIKYFHYPLLSEDLLGLQTVILNSITAACFILLACLGKNRAGDRFALHIRIEFVILLCSMILPLLLLYSFICAYVTG